MSKPNSKPPNLQTQKRFGRGMAFLGLLVWLAAANLGFAGESTFTEYQVKALFLLNFTKYVDWPASTFASTNTPITIGVYGENSFGDKLQQAVAGKIVNGRSIVIRQVDTTNDLAGCQILFLGKAADKSVVEVLGCLKLQPVLTVGETDHFSDLGGIILFFKKEGKIRLEINLPAARQAGLVISSKLLNVADLLKVGTK